MHSPAHLYRLCTSDIMHFNTWFIWKTRTPAIIKHFLQLVYYPKECKTFRNLYHRLGRVFWLSCIYFYYQRAFSVSDCSKGSARLQWLLLHVRILKTWHMWLQLTSIIWVFKLTAYIVRQLWQLTLYWNPINYCKPRAIWKKIHCTCFTSNTFSLSDRQSSGFFFVLCAGVI